MTFNLRIMFCTLVATMLYLALTPGPLGHVVAQGEVRHLLAFIVLPLVSSLAWPRLSLREQFFGYALLGALIEVAQGWMALGRAAQFDDWTVDLVASAVALGGVGLVRGVRRLVRT